MQYKRLTFLVEGKSWVLSWSASSYCQQNEAIAWFLLLQIRRWKRRWKHWNAKPATTWPKAHMVLPRLNTGHGVDTSFSPVKADILWWDGPPLRIIIPSAQTLTSYESDRSPRKQKSFYEVHEVNTYSIKEAGNTTNTELNTLQLWICKHWQMTKNYENLDGRCCRRDKWLLTSGSTSVQIQ
jgi:hypothetical protein